MDDDKISVTPTATAAASPDDHKQVVKKKSRFPFFRVYSKRSSSNETPKQNKNSDKSSSNEPRGTLRKYASAGNLQELADNMGMSPSASSDNLQEAEGSVSQGESPCNLSERPTIMHKHSVSTGNIPEVMTKGGMSYSKSTSNLQDLKKSGMRRYASALNLLDLDINEEVDAEEEGDDNELENCAGDVSIDDQADQFIKQFYQQMKSQQKPKRDNTNNQ